jgi:hypothetical protein
MELFVTAFRSYFGQTPLPSVDDVASREKYLWCFVEEYHASSPTGQDQSFLLAFMLLRLEESRHGPGDALGMPRDVFIAYAPAGLDSDWLGRMYDKVATSPRIVPPRVGKSQRPMRYANGCTLL